MSNAGRWRYSLYEAQVRLGGSFTDRTKPGGLEESACKPAIAILSIMGEHVSSKEVRRYLYLIRPFHCCSSPLFSPKHFPYSQPKRQPPPPHCR